MRISFTRLLPLILLISSSLLKRPCPKYEIIKACPGCPATCQRRKPAVCLIPCTFQCACRDSYIRDEESGKCVKVCPQKLTTEIVILTPSHDDNPKNGTLHQIKNLHLH
ncbi:hypothetical protein ILUMI_26194 [Ignelater luminosus]|uniref:TIL domain-containing protein n=1 Tax=Ignelater luminosus TaxID=2038154 RepID=A0A8K0C6Y8_IGNLU|nr:hypothetical protein ILUMI_26194 [Ignelater luminosus]